MRPPAHTSSASVRLPPEARPSAQNRTARKRAKAAEFAEAIPGLQPPPEGVNPYTTLPAGFTPAHPERPTHEGIPAPKVRGDCLTPVQRWAIDARYGDGVPRTPPRYLPVVREDGRTVMRPADAKPPGVNARRPCPYVGCRHHLAHFYDNVQGVYHLTGANSVDALLDALERGAKILDAGRGWAYIRDTLTPEERADPTYGEGAMVFSCALDVAMAFDEPTLELVGLTFERTRERVRQLEAEALVRVREILRGTPWWDEFKRALAEGSLRTSSSHHLEDAMTWDNE